MKCFFAIFLTCFGCSVEPEKSISNRSVSQPAEIAGPNAYEPDPDPSSVTSDPIPDPDSPTNTGPESGIPVNGIGDGYLNAEEYRLGKELLDGRVPSEFVKVDFRLAASAKVCDETLSYGPVPRSNSPDFGEDGSYKICMRLTDATGVVVFKETATFVLDRSPPVFAGVTDLMPFETHSKVMLSWEPSSDAMSALKDIYYDICIGETPGRCASSFVADISVDPLNWNRIIDQLKHDKEYEFVVRARDRAGNRDKNDKAIVSNKRLTGVASLAFSGSHACAVMKQGPIRCWGRNHKGQLGDGTRSHRSRPVEVAGTEGASAISAAYATSCAVTAAKKVVCWGGDTDTPKIVSGSDGAIDVSISSQHGCALLQDRTVSCWGSNTVGQLGQGTKGGYFQGANPVPELTNVKAVRVASGRSCALLTDGSAKCWGGNAGGGLGDGTEIDRLTPVSVVGLSDARSLEFGGGGGCALTTDAEVLCWGDLPGKKGKSTVPVSLPELTSVSYLADRCVGFENGSYKCWDGDGEKLQPIDGLPPGTLFSGASPNHCALLPDTSVKCWGDYIYGQLGRKVPHTVKYPVVVKGLSDVKQVAVGGSHSCALLSDKSVRCWGKNNWGQLGDGTTVSRFTPQKIEGLASVHSLSLGRNHSCALLENRTVQCWGYGSTGQLGIKSSELFRPFPGPVPDLGSVESLASGADFYCAILTDASLKCWGNSPNEIYYSPRTIPEVQNVSSVSIGLEHACVSIKDGTVKCWGYNGYGQIGTGKSTTEFAPVNGIEAVRNVTLGTHASCAVFLNGKAKCWGYPGAPFDVNIEEYSIALEASTISSLNLSADSICAVNASGQIHCLGYGMHPPSWLVPPWEQDEKEKVKKNFYWEEAVGQVSQIAMSIIGNHSCALRSDRKVVCVGFAAEGALGSELPLHLNPGPVLLK